MKERSTSAKLKIARTKSSEKRLSSSAMGDHFQILRVEDRSAIGSLIIVSPQMLEVFTQRRLTVLVERAKRFLRRTIVKPKVLDNFSGRERKVPVNVLKPSFYLRDAFTESLANSFFHAPQHRKPTPRR